MTTDERVTALEKEVAALKLALGERLSFQQQTPARVWEIEHFLPYTPFVYVLNGEGKQLFADVRHVSNTEIKVEFITPMAGTVYLV